MGFNNICLFLLIYKCLNFPLVWGQLPAGVDRFNEDILVIIVYFICLYFVFTCMCLRMSQLARPMYVPLSAAGVHGPSRRQFSSLRRVN